MKKLAIKISAFLPLALIIIGTNWFVDPGNLFHGKAKGMEWEIAEAMIAGDNVELVNWNMDDRLILKDYIDQLQPRPDIIALGSSRAMQLNSASFPGKKFFNTSSAGSSMEDYVAVIDMLHERNLLPEEIIIGVDPWLFNRNNNQVRWATLKDEYTSGLAWLGVTEGGAPKPDNYRDLKEKRELFSFGYFQSSLKYLLKGIAGGTDVIRTQETDSENTIRFADGSREYAAEWRRRTVDDVRAIAGEYTSETPVYSLGKFHVLDEAYQRIFEAILDKLAAENIKVTIFLPPYHPLVYSTLMESRDYKIIGDVEKYVRDIAAVRGIKVVGSYDPSQCGIVDSEFLDGMHTSRGSMKKLFN